LNVRLKADAAEGRRTSAEDDVGFAEQVSGVRKKV